MKNRNRNEFGIVKYQMFADDIKRKTTNVLQFLGNVVLYENNYQCALNREDDPMMIILHVHLTSN